MNKLIVFIGIVAMMGCKNDSSPSDTQNNGYGFSAKLPREGKNDIVVIKNLTYPKWIEGAWHNYYESNTHKFMTCMFADNMLTIRRGLYDTTAVVVEPYWNHTITEVASDSVYTINLKATYMDVQCGFMLQSVDWDTKSHLSFGVTENGKSTMGCVMMLRVSDYQ